MQAYQWILATTFSIALLGVVAGSWAIRGSEGEERSRAISFWIPLIVIVLIAGVCMALLTNLVDALGRL
jgi:hypothetical protein